MLHDARPPQVEAILVVLRSHDVQFVVTGSVAALLHGVELDPGDLDIVPELTIGNLERLLGALKELEARPAGPFGAWTAQPNGELKWITRPTTQENIEAWVPDVHDVSSLDHQYRTRLGNLDVVPSVTGTHEVLKRRATQVSASGQKLWVAHIDDILARLTVPRRDKDAPRVAALRKIQRMRGEGRGWD